MKTLSLKLDDSVFTETEQVINHIKNPETGILMKPWIFIIRFKKESLIAAKLEKESKLVKDDSIQVLHEFEMIDYEG